MTDYLAFHNDSALAESVRAQIAAHEAADEIIQGAYWENGKGCFIGCIAHGDSPRKVQELTGFPQILTRIAEGIFEDLPNDVAKGFPQRVISAPRIGADLSLVSWKFLHWCVTDALDQFGTDEVRKGCEDAIQVLDDKANGREISTDAARAATYAARAATYAAHAVDAAGAHAAARAVAHAADAADAAARAVYAARIRQADKLVELLKAA